MASAEGFFAFARSSSTLIVFCSVMLWPPGLLLDCLSEIYLRYGQWMRETVLAGKLRLKIGITRKTITAPICLPEGRLSCQAVESLNKQMLLHDLILNCLCAPVR
jgi:hypothetical protein